MSIINASRPWRGSPEAASLIAAASLITLSVQVASSIIRPSWVGSTDTQMSSSDRPKSETTRDSSFTVASMILGSVTYSPR